MCRNTRGEMAPKGRISFRAIPMSMQMFIFLLVVAVALTACDTHTASDTPTATATPTGPSIWYRNPSPLLTQEESLQDEVLESYSLPVRSELGKLLDAYDRCPDSGPASEEADIYMRGMLDATADGLPEGVPSMAREEWAEVYEEMLSMLSAYRIAMEETCP